MHRVLACATAQPLHGIAATRAIEARAQVALAPHTLMRRAGLATARLAVALAPHARRFWIVCGPGNNGGDGLEAAVQLRALGRAVGVRLLGEPARLPEDARDALARARAAAVPLDAAPEGLDAHDLAIDALLGVGAARAPSGALADAVATLNGLACPVLAIDLPTGLSADTGAVLGAAVRARHTLTLLTCKPGLFTAEGRDHAGDTWVDDLGVAHAEPPGAWLAPAPGALAVRAHASHKGRFGDVAVVGGAPGMTGAVLLAGRAAHAAGAGRVWIECVRDAGDGPAPDLDPARPELMFRAGWTARAERSTLDATTVVCGCGGGRAVVEPLLRLVPLAARLVLDADALNAVAADESLAAALERRAARGGLTVLTPHPLEAARLLGATSAVVQADRLAAAQALAQRHRAVVVLKGSGSIVAAPDRVPFVNATGHGGLASAGSGDVLAGWIGGRWAACGAAGQVAALHAQVARSVAEHGAAGGPPSAAPARAADLVEALHAQLAGRAR